MLRPSVAGAAILVAATVLAGCVADAPAPEPAAGPSLPAAQATAIAAVTDKALLSTPGQRASEFWVERHPQDPMTFAMGWMEYTTLDNFCLFSTTHDGGRTWSAPVQPFGQASDPWLAWAPDGTLHGVCNTSNYAQSRDGGATWERQDRPETPGNDRPAILADSRGRLHHCSSDPSSNLGPIIVHSDDAGATWTDVAFGVDGPSWEDKMCNSIEEGPDGTLYTAIGLSMFRVAVSTDGGATWQERARIDLDDPRRANYGNLVPTHKEGNMYPSFAVSPVTGHLFAGVLRFEAEANSGVGAYHVELHRSEDQGLTFDRLAWPEAPAECDPCDSTRPVVHVDDAGRLGVLWRTAQLSLPVQTWFSASLDEGITWLSPVLLGTEAVDQGWFTPRSIDGADHYWAMASTPEGFLVLWIDRTADGWSGLWSQILQVR